jgi:transaldolase
MPIKIFADGADLVEIEELAADPRISGFTTNPTLMRKAGVENYEAFCRGALELIGDKPISFEVFADDEYLILDQARTIASWEGAGNVYVKIPVTTTKGWPLNDVVRDLSIDGIKVNVTAVFTSEQIKYVGEALSHEKTPAIVSVFAGRIEDTGRSAFGYMHDYEPTLRLPQGRSHIELLWASPRQVKDIRTAERAGCQIITVTKALLDKMSLFDKDLDEYSLETVKMFYDDAKASGYTI